VIHFKTEVLECECDMPTVHSFLAKMTKTHGVPVEDIIASADRLFERTPPEMLKALAPPNLKALLEQKRYDVIFTTIQNVRIVTGLLL